MEQFVFLLESYVLFFIILLTVLLFVLILFG